MLKALKLLRACLTSVSLGMAREHSGHKIEVDLDGVIITVHEATVMEIRSWLKSLREAKTFDVIDSMLFEAEEVTISDLVRLSDAPRSIIESFPPSQLIKLAQAVKEANPFFFRFRQNLFKLDKLQNSA